MSAVLADTHTAIRLDVPLVTRDQKIQGTEIRTIW